MYLLVLVSVKKKFKYFTHLKSSRVKVGRNKLCYLYSPRKCNVPSVVYNQLSTSPENAYWEAIWIHAPTEEEAFRISISILLTHQSRVGSLMPIKVVELIPSAEWVSKENKRRGSFFSSLGIKWVITWVVTACAGWWTQAVGQWFFVSAAAAHKCRT